jgi:UDP-N-acetyl-D-galactosamine dehydrogenase
MGLAFKENCPDLRNTRVIDIVTELKSYHCDVDIYDPWASSEEAMHEYGVPTIAMPKLGSYDGIIVAVAHQEFKDMGAKVIRDFGKSNHVLYDLKYILPESQSDIRL